MNENEKTPPYTFKVGQEAIDADMQIKLDKFNKLPEGHAPVLYNGAEYEVESKNPENLTVTIKKGVHGSAEFGLENISIDDITFTADGHTL